MSNIRFAIIMGATSGIGYEVARILAQRGWKVGVAGRRKDILAKMVAENDGIVAYEVVDVTSAQAVDGMHRLINKLGGMDMYFHSSGIGYQNTDLDADKELRTIETNCLGMAKLTAEAFRYFEQHPETDGQIAVISSISRTKGLGAAPAYSASKRFTSHYLECLCQLTSIRKIHNIHITDIRPGFVKTPLIEGSNFPNATRRKKSCREYCGWNRAAQTSNHHQLALSSACFLLAYDSAVNLDKNESKMNGNTLTRQCLRALRHTYGVIYLSLNFL